MDRRQVAGALFVGLAASGACGRDASEAARLALCTTWTVVTGREEPNRLRGFGICLEYALVKASGDPSLRTDPRLAGWIATAAPFVRSFSYRDIKEGKPIHDEQGSYDRPHVLTVVFEPEAIEKSLAVLGRGIWVTPRPVVAVAVAVSNVRASFALSASGTVDRSADMRASLRQASDRVALPVVLPGEDALTPFGAEGRGLEDAPTAPLAALAATTGAQALLVGRMAFREEAVGWVADWRLERSGTLHRWGIRGVNFDAVFRNGLLGAGQVLSGHGTPQALGLDLRFPDRLS